MRSAENETAALMNSLFAIPDHTELPGAPAGLAVDRVGVDEDPHDAACA